MASPGQTIPSVFPSQVLISEYICVALCTLVILRDPERYFSFSVTCVTVLSNGEGMEEGSELLAGSMSLCMFSLLNISSEVVDILCKVLWSPGRKNECE